MKYLKFVLLIVSMFTIFLSCKKKDNTPSSDCTFIQNDNDMDGLISDLERSKMDDCIDNALTSKTAIEENLIGSWQLVGHGEGWVPSISQPCAYITITADELIFAYEDAYVDTLTTHTWEVEEIAWPNGTYFRLNVTDYNHGLAISQFCDEYMYGDATPLDGNMYLYRKVE